MSAFGTERGEESLAQLGESAGQALLAREWTVAVAESCTGGWVMKAMTEIPGSSRYLLGGVVAYADGAKSRLLEVRPDLISRFGAVSEEVARAMAEGVCRQLGANVGVSVTGIAGPSGGTEEKPIGTVWFGVAMPWGVHSESARFDGGRDDVREAAVRHALRLLLRAIGNGLEGTGDRTPAGGVG